jgi:uncharacterized iron-regulated membrane protein
MKLSIREIFITIHRGVGLTVGILFCIVGLTGSFLVAQDSVVYGYTYSSIRVTPQSAKASIESILAAAQKTHPDFKIAYFTPPYKQNFSFEVSLSKKGKGDTEEFITVDVNPYTTQVLDEKKEGEGLISWIYNLHDTLGLGWERGSPYVGVEGIFLTVIALSGLIIYPNWKNLRYSLKIRWKTPWKLLSYDIHKVWGVITALFLMIIAITGVGMIFIEPYSAFINSITQSPEALDDNPPKSTVLPGQERLSADAIWQRANEAVPGGRVAWVVMPDQSDAAYNVSKIDDHESNRWRSHAIYLDQYTGKILAIEDAYKLSLGSYINAGTLSLHAGTFGGGDGTLGGGLTRLLYFWIGIAPTILFVTGLGIWSNKRRRSSTVVRPGLTEAIAQSNFVKKN